MKVRSRIETNGHASFKKWRPIYCETSSVNGPSGRILGYRETRRNTETQYTQSGCTTRRDRFSMCSYRLRERKKEDDFFFFFFPFSIVIIYIFLESYDTLLDRYRSFFLFFKEQTSLEGGTNRRITDIDLATETASRCSTSSSSFCGNGSTNEMELMSINVRGNARWNYLWGWVRERLVRVFCVIQF